MKTFVSYNKKQVAPGEIELYSIDFTNRERRKRIPESHLSQQLIYLHQDAFVRYLKGWIESRAKAFQSHNRFNADRMNSYRMMRSILFNAELHKPITFFSQIYNNRKHLQALMNRKWQADYDNLVYQIINRCGQFAGIKSEQQSREVA